MIIFAKIIKSIIYKDFILLNVHPAKFSNRRAKFRDAIFWQDVEISLCSGNNQPIEQYNIICKQIFRNTRVSRRA